MRHRWRLYAGLGATWMHRRRSRSPADHATCRQATARTTRGPGPTCSTSRCWSYDTSGCSVWPADLVLYYGWPAPLTMRQVLPYVVGIGAALAGTAALLWRVPARGIPRSVRFSGARADVQPRPHRDGSRCGAADVSASCRASRPRRRRHRRAPGIAGGSHRSRCPGHRAPRSGDDGSECRVSVQPAAGGDDGRALAVAGGHSMAGVELAAAGRMPEAEHHLRQAIAEYPPARYYLGTVLVAQKSAGRSDRAISDRSLPGSLPSLNRCGSPIASSPAR